jgi:hypothetical protein
MIHSGRGGGFQYRYGNSNFAQQRGAQFAAAIKIKLPIKLHCCFVIAGCALLGRSAK